MMYPVVFIGFFGVVRFVPDFFALDRGFLTPPFETVLGVLGVLGVRGAAFPFAVFVEAVGADFFPPVGVFASAARVVARFVGATFFFLLFVRAGFFAMTIRVGVDGGEARCGARARDWVEDGAATRAEREDAASGTKSGTTDATRTMRYVTKCCVKSRRAWETKDIIGRRVIPRVSTRRARRFVWRRRRRWRR